jgi:hypothetical protein
VVRKGKGKDGRRWRREWRVGEKEGGGEKRMKEVGLRWRE